MYLLFGELPVLLSFLALRVVCRLLIFLDIVYEVVRWDQFILLFLNYVVYMKSNYNIAS